MRPGPAQYAEAYAQAAQSVGEAKAAEGLVRLLRRKARASLLPEILAALEEEAARRDHAVRLSITTAVSLDAGLKDALTAKARTLFPEAKTLDIDFRIDPSVLGGFRIDGPERRYDATVATGLHELSRRISQ